MNIEELEHEEKMNFVLVSLKRIETEPPFSAPQGITPKNIEFYSGLKEDFVVSILKELIGDDLVNAEQYEGNSYSHCRCSDKANKMFEDFEKRTLNSISSIILGKCYEWYRRYNYNMDLQINSIMITYALGIANSDKVMSAIQNLISKGLLRKLAVTREFISFTLTIEGVNYMESPKEKPAASSPIIIHGNQGNISIASNNVSQTINRTELERSFKELEVIIRRELEGEQQKEALENLEAAEELSKSDKPKKSVIGKVLGFLPQIPIIIDGIKNIISSIPS